MSRRKRWIRRAVLLVIVLGLGYAGWRWGAMVTDKVALLYWQRQCLNYTPSANQVAYDEDTSEAQKLLAKGPEYSAYPINRTQVKDPATAFNASAFVPRCWTKFGLLAGPSYQPWAGSAYGSIVFLHERVSPAGHRRLVVVRYFPETNTFNPQLIGGFNYDARVITPATLRAAPVNAPQIYAIDVISAWPNVPPKVRMYCGEVDPANASHFTVRYEFWGKSDTLDGYLDDKDNVTLTPRKLPLDAQWSRAMGREN